MEFGTSGDGHRFDTSVKLILHELRLREDESIRVLWRTGDIVNDLKCTVTYGLWRQTIRACAERVGLHAKWLDEAARTSAAFPAPVREKLIDRFIAAGATLRACHVVELARVAPVKRAQGIEALLRAPHSVRELRACLRSKCRDCRGISESRE